MNKENQVEQSAKASSSSTLTDNAIAELEQQLHQQTQLITQLKVRCFDAENTVSAYQELFSQLAQITGAQSDQELLEYVKKAQTN